MSTRPGRPLVVAGALLLAIVGATVFAERVRELRPAYLPPDPAGPGSLRLPPLRP